MENEAVREAIMYRYKAVPIEDFEGEVTMYENWEFITVSNGYWIFRAENKGLAIPANREMVQEMNTIHEARMNVKC